MNLFVLSELNPDSKHVGRSVSYTLETTLASSFDPVFIYPILNYQCKFSKGYQLIEDKFAFIKRGRQRLFKSWYKISELPALGEGPNVLLVVALTPDFLLSLHALGPLLKQFDLQIAYLLDGFSANDFDRSLTDLLDHVFVIDAELADDINNSSPFTASWLPLATDVVKQGSSNSIRFIDLFQYGRGNSDVHLHLQKNYNQKSSNRIYLHTTFSGTDVHSMEEHVDLHSRLLANSKISLCFEASNVKRFAGRSPILYRWFEGWAAGCAIVGKKPFGKGVADLMNWEDSTFEIPDQTSEWIPFLEELLNDQERLLATSRRNYQEALLRHDWRYRIKQMFEQVGLPLPEQVNEQIAWMHQKAAALTAEIITDSANANQQFAANNFVSNPVNSRLVQNQQQTISIF